MPIRTTVQLNLTVRAEVAQEIRRKAKRAGLTISDYVAARIRDDATMATLPAATTDARVGYRIVSAIAAIEHGELSAATDHLRFAQRLMAEAFAGLHAPAIAQATEDRMKRLKSADDWSAF
jgi:hypothetical protein